MRAVQIPDKLAAGLLYDSGANSFGYRDKEVVSGSGIVWAQCPDALTAQAVAAGLNAAIAGRRP